MRRKDTSTIGDQAERLAAVLLRRGVHRMAGVAGREIMALIKLPIPGLQGALRRVTELTDGQPDPFAELDVQPDSPKSIFL